MSTSDSNRCPHMRLLTLDTAAGGFTKDHMESFIHLGTYALGALSNQHGLAPDAPHPEGEEE